MAIVKMNKFTLLSFESYKENLLEKIQSFQGVEFLNLQEDEVIENNEDLKCLTKDTIGDNYNEYQDNVLKLKSVLDFLNDYIPKKSVLKALKEGKKALTLKELENKVLESNWHQIYENVRTKEVLLSEILNEKNKLKGEIEHFEKWLKFDASFDSLTSLKSIKYYIGTIQKQYETTLLEELKTNVEDFFSEIIYRDNKDVYIFILVHKDQIEKSEEVIKKYGFTSMQINYKESPSELVTSFRERIKEISEKEDSIKNELQKLSEEFEIMQLVLEYYENLLVRSNASANFLKTNNVIVISGWIPVEDNDKFISLVKTVLGEDYYISFAEVKEEEIEAVPIKLKNGFISRAFESITEMYSLPMYNEIDPTPLLVPFYIIFFGIMVADAGYGALTLIACLLGLKFFNLEKGTKNFLRFFSWLSISTIVFGLIFGGAFGDAIKIQPLVKQTKDINFVLISSVVLGIIQIFIGLGIKAYMLIRDKHYLDAFYDVGSWVITLVGAGLFGIGGSLGLSASSISIAKYAMFVGMVLIVVTQGRAAQSVGAKLGTGLYALYGITSYIGDLVSYTRLMALGLSGGSIAGALNLIIGMVSGPIAVIITPILFIALHLFNLFLGYLGAYVHTCRLQYVEYFSKYYSGGGRAFRPFKPVEKYIDVKNE